MKKLKKQDKEVLKELGELIFFAYEGTDTNIAVPSDKSFIDVLDGLKHLKVLMKYQRFDLEATRRENQYLTNLLGEK